MDLFAASVPGRFDGAINVNIHPSIKDARADDPNIEDRMAEVVK